MSAEKIVRLNNNVINNHIEMFLKKKARQGSETTSKDYMRDLKKFFLHVKGKDIHFLNDEDVQLTGDDFENFITELHDSEELNNKTINRNVVAVKELIRYLHSKKVVSDISYLSEVERLPETENKHGIFSIEETMQAAEIVRNTGKMRDVKYFLILFAVDTCLRKSAILNLTWDDFEVRDDGVLVRAIDKGNTDARLKISHKFYEELLTIKKEGEPRVFPISTKAINAMMNTIREKMNLHNRNLVFHSWRKTGVTFRYRISGNDILEAKKAARHKNVQNTLLYVDEEDYGANGLVSMSDIDMELFKKVDHELLLETINEMKNFQLLLNIKLKQKLNK